MNTFTYVCYGCGVKTDSINNPPKEVRSPFGHPVMLCQLCDGCFDEVLDTLEIDDFYWDVPEED